MSLYDDTIAARIEREARQDFYADEPPRDLPDLGEVELSTRRTRAPALPYLSDADFLRGIDTDRPDDLPF